MRRKRSRFPFALVPTIVLLSAAIAFLTDGCFGHLIRGSSQPVDAPKDRSAAYLAQAIQAIHAGDNRNAQQFLLSAADERAHVTNAGEAYASIADDLLRQGYATQAVALLDGAVHNAAVSWSPLIWASLATACRSAGDPVRGASAAAHAEDAARVIVSAPASSVSSSQEAKLAAAGRYLELGAYETKVKKDTRAAILSYRQALALAPDSPQLKNALGSLLADAGTTDAEFDEALSLTKAAVSSVPDYGIFLDSYGWALFKKHQVAAALQVLTEAVADKPMEPKIHYHLGETFVQMGQLDDAIREFSRALVLRPDYVEALQAKTDAESAGKTVPIAPPPSKASSVHSLPAIPARP